MLHTKSLPFSKWAAVLLSVVALIALPAATPVGGITRWSHPITVADGATGYSGASATTDAVDTNGYGAVQVHAVNTISGTIPLTVVPQFSNQPVSCSAATSWFTGSLSSEFALNDVVPLTVTVPAASAEGREIPTLGRCLRFSLVPSSTTLFTPTVYIRFVNRQ